jgi:uncharacterized protein related to proFAR isomerase
MKLILNEEQLKMIKEYEKKSLYVVKFENIISAEDDEDALRQLEEMKQVIIEATKDGEWESSLDTRVGFGEKPRKIK